MTHRSDSTWIAFAAALAASALAGCSGCAADRRAEAQALDGGVIAAPSPIAPATCFVLAQERTRLVDDQILALCQGAPSTGPVECYEAAQSALLFTDPQRLALCRCAPSSAPVACVEMLQRETFLTDPEIAQLCSPTISGGLLANCRPTGGWY
jgi:hypothetical protein